MVGSIMDVTVMDEEHEQSPQASTDKLVHYYFINILYVPMIKNKLLIFNEFT